MSLLAGIGPIIMPNDLLFGLALCLPIFAAVALLLFVVVVWAWTTITSILS